MMRARVWFGVALSGAAGVTFGYAWTDSDAGLWLIALYARVPGDETPGADRAPVRVGKSHTSPSWRLGQLLVESSGLITERQLETALAMQRGTQRRLGQILVDLGFVRAEQLAIVLEQERPDGEVRRDLEPSVGAAAHLGSPRAGWGSESNL